MLAEPLVELLYEDGKSRDHAFIARSLYFY